MDGTSIKKMLAFVGIAWLFSPSMSLLFLWMFYYKLGLPLSPILILLQFNIAIAIVALLLSLVIKNTNRVLIRVWITGVGIVGLFHLFITFAVLYFYLLPNDLTSTWLLRGLFLLLLIWWCTKETLAYRQRIINSKYIEREFSVTDSCILYRYPAKTSLDAPPHDEKNFIGKIFHRYSHYLIILIPMAYPLQRLISSSGGDYAILFVLSLLCTPMAFWFLGGVSRGAYLHLYTVWQLEKKHGKPVMFDYADVK